MKRANRILTVLIFIFLYVPMAVLIVASFNTGKDVTQFEGFTLQQYARLFQDRTLLKLLGNSLLVSVLASFIATVFGTVASLGIYNLNPRLRKAAMTLTNIPMTNPDIVTGVSLSLLFLLTIYLSIVVIFTGEWFFRLLESRLPQALLDLVPLVTLSQLWGWLRYLLLFLLVLVLVLAVYRLGTPLPFRRRTRTLYLTALLSAAALVACSVLFSWFIGMSSRYSLVYGSLASLIILLVWLYFCGNILLLGAVAGRVWGQLRIPSGDD